MTILVSGSMAFDRIMDFPGKFSDHILPDKIHILNVCFSINGLKENFGGTAGNIAFALSLLGEAPTIVATGGRDFEPYGKWLMQNKIPVEGIRIIEEELTASAYITTDQSDNQITAFNPGAMKHSAGFSVDGLGPGSALAIVAPGNLDDMITLTRAYKEEKIPYIFDPGQSLPAWRGEQVIEMIEGSHIFICNDYELQLTMEKTSLSVEDILQKTEKLITTKGEFGSIVKSREPEGIRTSDIPAVKPKAVLDPTGAGDAYRAGLIRGLLLPGKDIVHACRMGSTCAAYSVEVYGTQNFRFTRKDFNQRFEEAFGREAY